MLMLYGLVEIIVRIFGRSARSVERPLPPFTEPGVCI